MSGERRAWTLAAVATALAAVALVLPALLGISVPVYRDLGTAVHPVLAEARALPGGGVDALPFWSNELSNGRPLLVNPGNSLLAPLSALYLVLPFNLAYGWFIGLHLALSAVGMLLLARRLGASPPSAALAGIAWSLGGYMVSSTNLYPTLAAAAWAPFVLLAALGAAARPTPWRLGLLALALAAEAVGGQPEPTLLTLVAGGVLTLVSLEGMSLARRVLRTALAWGVAGIWALLLAAPQVIPAALHARSSLRAFGFTADGLLYNSVHPARLAWLVLPGQLGGGNPLERLAGGFSGGELTDTSTPYFVSLYAGLVVALLAVAGLVLRRDRVRMALAALVVAGLALSLGKFLPGMTALAKAAPGAIPFRVPEKFVFLAFLAIPLLAAHGLDRVLALIPVPRTRTLLGIALAGLAALDLATTHRPRMLLVPPSDLAEPPLAAKLAELSPAFGAPDREWRVYHQRPLWAAPMAAGITSERELYHWQRGMLMPMTGASSRIMAAFEPTWDLLDLKGYFSLNRLLHRAPWPDRARVLGEAAVLWVLSPDADLEQSSESVLVKVADLGPELGLPPGSGYLYRNQAYVPRVRVTTADGSAAAGEARVAAEDHRSLTVKVTTAQDGLLVVSDVLCAGWSATLDGAAVPMSAAAEVFRVVTVPAGEHVVRFSYMPPGFVMGCTLAAAGLLALLVAAVVTLRGRRPSSRLPSER